MFMNNFDFLHGKANLNHVAWNMLFLFFVVVVVVNHGQDVCSNQDSEILGTHLPCEHLTS